MVVAVAAVAAVGAVVITMAVDIIMEVGMAVDIMAVDIMEVVMDMVEVTVEVTVEVMVVDSFVKATSLATTELHIENNLAKISKKSKRSILFFKYLFHSMSRLQNRSKRVEKIFSVN